jgi:hypothetical protein
LFISLSGEAGSGKSTVSDMIKDFFETQNLTVAPFSFAGPLKDALVGWTGWDRQRLDSDFAYKEGGLGNTDPDDLDDYCVRLGKTRRQIMQDFGTECMRDNMHPDFWVILAELGLKRGTTKAADVNIISDARFQNELNFITRQNGWTFRVKRIELLEGETADEGLIRCTGDNGATLTEHSSHASEQEWKSYEDFAYVFFNIIYPDDLERGKHELREDVTWILDLFQNGDNYEEEYGDMMSEKKPKPPEEPPFDFTPFVPVI